MSKQPTDKNSIEKTIVKARYWSFVLYPESAPADWEHRLQMLGLPFCISPLHDKDTDPTGQPKKEHFHVIVCYNGPTTFSNVKKTITDPLEQPHPQYLQSVKGMYRYLTHQDNPEKYQYNSADIKNMNGFNIQDYDAFSISDEDRCYNALEDIIQQEQLKEYCELIFYLKENGLTELLTFIRRNTFHIREFMKSLRHSFYFERLNNQQIDEETGEVLNNDTKE